MTGKDANFTKPLTGKLRKGCEFYWLWAGSRDGILEGRQ